MINLSHHDAVEIELHLARYSESLEDTFHNRTILAVYRVQLQAQYAGDEEASDALMELLDRLTGWCGPDSKLTIP